MSDPRHAMVFQCDESLYWLNIVPTTETISQDDSPLASETFGPFKDVQEARDYAGDNFQNTGFVIPLYKMIPFEEDES